MLTSSRSTSSVGPEREASNRTVLKFISGALPAVLAIGVLANLQDIKRYIKISTM